MSIAIHSGSSLSERARAACLALVARAAAADPIGAVAARRDDLAARRAAGTVANGAAPVVAFIVLIAVLALLAAAISVAVLIFCSQKGMNFEWYVKTSWFEVKVACKK